MPNGANNRKVHKGNSKCDITIKGTKRIDVSRYCWKLALKILGGKKGSQIFPISI